jgi:DNA-directed RNA polymerase subunit M/transcription elongation factor TFIIS
MALTTKCPDCQTVLNLPDGAEGRRLKCPKCGTKFHAGTPEARPRTSAPGVATAGPASSMMQSTPGPGKPKSSREVDLPTSGGDLRDTFDAGMLFGEDEPKPRSRPQQAASDAAALFDESTAPRQKITGGDAKKKSRRCPSCGGVVPIGMSLCQTCGLDIDTGRREHVDEMLDEELAPVGPVAKGPPIGVALIGSVTLIVSAILAILSMVRLPPEGGIPLAIVCLFGLFASIQFLRGRSVKLLLIALLIGGVIDIIGLIIMPAWQANQVTIDPQVTVSPLDEDIEMKPLDERIDYNKLMLGLAILGVDVIAFIYLSTAGIKRHFDKHRTISHF